MIACLCIFGDEHKHFPSPDHAEFVARSLLDRHGSNLKIPHIGLKGSVALYPPQIVALLSAQLTVKVPNPQPAPLAKPEWILDEHDKADEYKAETARGEHHPWSLRKVNGELALSQRKAGPKPSSIRAETIEHPG